MTTLYEAESEADLGRSASDPDLAEADVGADERAGKESDAADEKQAGEASYHTVRIPKLPFVRIAGAVLFGLGLLIVFFFVYLFAFTPLTASRNQQRLSLSLIGQPKQVFSLVAGKTPTEGSPVAVLSVPALDLHQVVVQGTSGADLMNGPGLMPGTALPGSPGNSVIAGRRVTFGGPFGQIGTLRRGDRIRIVDGIGVFTYRVRRIFTVTAGERDVVVPTNNSQLNLVTSDSAFLPSGRLVVQARLVGLPVEVPNQVLEIPANELGLAGDPVAGGLAMLWSLALIVVLVIAVLVAWAWRRPLIIYVFAAPVVVACGLLACESVARALPATF